MGNGIGILNALAKRIHYSHKGKKYIDFPFNFQVDLLYNGNPDSILENDLTLLDIAFIYKWNKVSRTNKPFKQFFRYFFSIYAAKLKLNLID